MSYYVQITSDHRMPVFIDVGRLYPTSMIFTAGCGVLIQVPDHQGGTRSLIARLSEGMIISSRALETVS